MNRYDSYKDLGVEWIGEIPSHWVKSKLKYNNQISLSNIDKKEYEHLKPHPIIHYNDVIKYGDIDKSIDLGVGYCSESQYLSFKVSLGDIIITKDSMDVKNICDSTIITEELEGVVYGYHLMKLSNERNEIHPRFTYYFFKNVKTKEYFLNNSNGTTIIGVSKNTVENTIQLLLPLSEQQQIVSFLDTKTTLIDSLIEKTKQKIKLLEEKRISLINEVVTQGLNPNVEKKESGVEWIGKIPSHWITPKLGFYTTKIGSGSTPRGGSETYVDSGVPFIRSQNVHFEGLKLENISHIEYETHKSMKGSTVVKGDVLLNITGGSIGRCCVVNVEGEMNTNQHVSIIRTTKNLLNTFLNYILKSDVGQSQVIYNISGGNREGLTIEGIRNFITTLPSISEQQQIVEYLDEKTQLIERTISIEEKRTKLLKEYKQSLISEVVTGKKKVVS